MSTPNTLTQALDMFPETDERHWRVVAYALNLAAHRALQHADMLAASKGKGTRTPNKGARWTS